MNVMSSIDTKEEPATEAVDELWYKDAIIYQLHVKAFADSNNDGIGDFAGLTEKLGYLQELGVTALWLLPFYPSPGRDDGYDIADYGDINPDFGSMKDFRRFIVEAKRRGLKVITELVINHTSDQHDWFKRARRSDPKSSARNWYVWSDTDQKYQGTRIIFTDTEKSNWTWDPEAGQFYWHRFFSHQPDLNFDNPRVVSALIQVMKRWLDAGVDGFRLDAIPYLCERDGTNNENLPETHAIIKKLRGELDAYSKGKVLLAEANQWPEDVQEYFGRGDECHMAYHFPLMPRIYMAIAQEDRFPITDILRQTPDIPANCQWALFLRNHDELTLEMVTDVERDYLWSTYANDPRARINLGIRRRLAPLMDNDRRKIELMNSLLLSFPGTPIIYYGDEIGMGDNIYLGDRNGVRTPMQWTPDRNGGFSRADPARLYAPTIMDPVYGYEVGQCGGAVAQPVFAAERDQAPDLGAQVDAGVRPRHADLHSPAQPLGAGLCQAIWRRGDPLRRQPVALGASHRTRSVGLEGAHPAGNAGPHVFPADRRTALHDHAGALWLLLVPARRSPTSRSRPSRPRCRNSRRWWCRWARPGCRWRATRGVFERDVLPGHLARTRWYPERSPKAIQPTLTSAIPFCDIGDNRPWLAFFETTQRNVTTRYLLPMQIEWVALRPRTLQPARARGRAPGRARRHAARCRHRPDLHRAVAAQFAESPSSSRKASCGSNSGRPASSPTNRSGSPSVFARWKPSNPTAPSLVDNDYVVKLYRKLEPGINPEIEIGRFLTEIAGFANTPALLGSVELVEGETSPARSRSFTRFVENQGDGWTVTAAYLDRFVEEQRLLGSERTSPAKAKSRPPYLRYMAQTGRRVAEMHLALASRDGYRRFRARADPARGRRTLDRRDDDARRARVRRAAAAPRRASRKPTAQLIDQLLAQRGSLRDRLNDLLPPDIDA